MAIGQRMGNLKSLKKSLAKGGSNSTWIKFVPKNGSMNIRFIEEPENWINYVEHWEDTLRRSYPCNGEVTCPGCITGQRKTNRYLTNAVDVDADRVIALQLPKDLANRLVVRYERNGTLVDRDFELSRAGEGLDTVYDLDAGPSDRKNISKFSPIDLMKVLEDTYEEMFNPNGDVPDTPPPAATKGPRARAKSPAAAATIAKDTDPEVDTDDDETPASKPPKAAAKRAAAKQATPVPEPVFTPDTDDDDDDGEAYDEETLRNLPLGALRAVAREFGVEPKGLDQNQIVDAILEAGEPAEGEPPF